MCFHQVKNRDYTPIAKVLGADAHDTPHARADNVSTLALYDGKNFSTARFARGLFPPIAAPNNTGNTTETTRARPGR